MSVVSLVVAVAAVTVASRVAALAVLPPPRGRAAVLVGRLPAPLFAALAAVSISGTDGGLRDPRLLAAVGCALVSTRWSSLLVTLGAGLGGFVAVGLLG